MTRILALALVLATASCASFSKDYPDKSYYAFEVSRPGEAVMYTDDDLILLVQRFRPSALQPGPGLVYRTGPSTYESDYYAEYFTEPESMLTLATSSWFSDAGLFSTVLLTSGTAEPDFVLQGALRRLYVDISKKGAPTAVIELQLFLSRRDGPFTAPIWNADFRRAEAAASASGPDVMQAWNRAIASILAEAENAIEPQLVQAH